MRVCKFCGDQFAWERKPGQRGRAKLFCSPTCQHRSRYVTKPPRDPKDVAESASRASKIRWARMSAADRSAAATRAVNARFTPEQRAAAAERRSGLEAQRQVPCPYCGDPVGRAGRVKCPKDACRLAYNAARMGVYIHERRAKRSGSGYERFSPLEVFERDGWECGICADPVDPLLSWPDPASASLDHIIPLALGGEHSRANTQCAHLYCNNVKGARAAV